MVHMQALKNIETALQLAINIGQSWTCIAILSLIKYEDVLNQRSPILDKSKYRLQIVRLMTEKLEETIHYIQERWKFKNLRDAKLYLSGDESGVKSVRKIFNIPILERDEIDSIVKGCTFLLANVKDEAFNIENEENSNLKFLNTCYNFYPFIFVTITSDVKFIKVVSEHQYEVLGNSALNIADIMNFSKILLNTEDFSKTVHFAKCSYLNREHKLNNNVTNRINNSNIFTTNNCSGEDIGKEDIAYNLISLFCGNLGQIVSLHAQVHNIKKVICGDLLSNDVYLKRHLNEAIKQWSNDSINAIFLRHDDFLFGAGSFLVEDSPSVLQKSWIENYSLSSGMGSQQEQCTVINISARQLSLDSLGKTLTCSPLLANSTEYCPDIQNLSIDANAREYWIKCIQEGVEQGMNVMIFEMTNPETVKCLSAYKNFVIDRLNYLHQFPQSYGNLSMRVLQDTMEHGKREMGLVTMYEERKTNENSSALKEMEGRLLYLDTLADEDRQKEIIKSMLAGNMFDWGAKVIVKLLATGHFGFTQAMEKLPGRPWLVDDLDIWLKKLKGPGHRLSMIFVDNCGYDLLLGVLPFARELLKRGTQVILCANSEPIINDVTHYELKSVLEECRTICPILGRAYDQGRLSTMEMAKSSCCLDLSMLDEDICEKMKEVDLLVIEGMGRAVHTNLNALFNKETLLVAVIKDNWMSKQLGGGDFAAICKHIL